MVRVVEVVVVVGDFEAGTETWWAEEPDFVD